MNLIEATTYLTNTMEEVLTQVREILGTGATKTNVTQAIYLLSKFMYDSENLPVVTQDEDTQEFIMPDLPEEEEEAVVIPDEETAYVPEGNTLASNPFRLEHNDSMDSSDSLPDLTDGEDTPEENRAPVVPFLEINFDESFQSQVESVVATMPSTSNADEDENNADENRCTICETSDHPMNPSPDPRMGCIHRLCTDCQEKCYLENQRCPFCRGPILPRAVVSTNATGPARRDSYFIRRHRNRPNNRFWSEHPVNTVEVALLSDNRLESLHPSNIDERSYFTRTGAFALGRTDHQVTVINRLAKGVFGEATSAQRESMYYRQLRCNRSGKCYVCMNLFSPIYKEAKDSCDKGCNSSMCVFCREMWRYHMMMKAESTPCAICDKIDLPV